MSPNSPRRLGPGDAALAGVRALVESAFAYMEGRMDPPPAALGLTPEDVNDLAARAEIWAIEDEGRVIACISLTPQEGVLSLGNLAVAVPHRGHGLARCLVDLAADRARALGLRAVETRAGVELTDSHNVFAALGFRLSPETGPPGLDGPTEITFVRPVRDCPPP